MGRGGKCPLCGKSRVLARHVFFVDSNVYYVYLCESCLKKIYDSKIKPF